MMKLVSAGLVFSLYFLHSLFIWQLSPRYSAPVTSPNQTRPDAPVNVLTQHNDNSRTGANLSETILNVANVNARQFGKLFTRSVEGYIYAQPLYAAQVSLPGQGVRNVVYVATERNHVYAFDADDPAAAEPLWRISLGLPVPSANISPTYRDLTPEIGVTSTPVIDLATRTIYVVAKSKNTTANTYHQRLHALDLATGREKPGSPVEIAASVSGTGAGAAGGVIRLDPLLNLNRPGLLLLNGVVYLAFGSHGGTEPYHGWVLGYDARTLRQTAVFNTTPDGGKGAVWHSGQGLVADAENYIYLVTGNGDFNAQNGGRNYGDSALKLSTANGLTVADYHTPFNEAVLNAIDADLGSGGPVLLPGANRLVFTGKDTVLRVLDTKNLGRFDPQTDKIVQRFQASTRRYLGAPVFWNSPNHGPVIYYWSGGDYLKVFQLINGRLQEYPATQSTLTSVVGVSNAPPMSLSANGSRPGTGIVWAATPVGGDANRSTVPGILRAFNATDVSEELWNSRLDAARDDTGNFAKFCPPTVANGKVYVPTFSGQLHVFGLLPGVCAYSLSQPNLLVTAGSYAGSVRLEVEYECNWLASSNDDWIAITSGGKGPGAGAVGYSVAANPDSTMRTGTISVAGLTFTITQAGAASLVSAASFDRAQLARGSIATAFGSGLAASTSAATSGLPTSLAGTSVKVTDFNGTERLAPLFFVSPTQVNYQLPPDTAIGSAVVRIISANGNLATGSTQIERVAPGLFSANANGQGVAAAVALRVKAGGAQTYEPVAQFAAAQNRFIPRPIDLGPNLGAMSDQVFLVLFGTGIRFRSALEAVKSKIGEVDAPVAFAGAQGSFVGLDQVNLLLPRALAGRGEVNVSLTVDGKPANPVKVSVK